MKKKVVVRTTEKDGPYKKNYLYGRVFWEYIHKKCHGLLSSPQMDFSTEKVIKLLIKDKFIEKVNTTHYQELVIMRKWPNPLEYFKENGLIEYKIAPCVAYIKVLDAGRKDSTCEDDDEEEDDLLF